MASVSAIRTVTIDLQEGKPPIRLIVAPTKPLDVRLTGARGPIGLEIDGDPLDRAGKLVEFVGVGRRVAPVSGGGADPTLRTDMQSRTGGSLLAYFYALDTAAVRRTMNDKGDDELSVKDYGAIGDGVPRPVSQWLVGGTRPHPAGFADLADIQAVYPDVFALDNEIDFAAMNKAVRVATATGKGVFFPAGRYLGWIYAYENNVSIRGAGSSCTEIIIPDSASIDVVYTGGDGLTYSGCPNVVEFNRQAFANDLHPLSGGHISGLTLNGNRANTPVPGTDILGHGLAFNQYSHVTGHDLVVTGTHCVGVLPAINSNYQMIFGTIRDCGKSEVLGGVRPGFDANSSKYSQWGFIVEDCPYGGRALDNIRHCIIEINGTDISITGFVLYNQSINEGSWGNVIRCTFDGGCADYAFTMGPRCFDNDILVLSSGVEGAGYRDVIDGTPANNPINNRIRVTARKAQFQAALIYSSGNDFDIISDQCNRDGVGGPEADYQFAIDNYGSNNRFKVRHSDSIPWASRGVVHRTGAAGNRLESFIWDNTQNPYVDTDETNFFPWGFKGSSTLTGQPDLAAGESRVIIVSVSGARDNMDFIVRSKPAIPGVILSGWTEADDIVKVQLFNPLATPISIPSPVVISITGGSN